MPDNHQEDKLRQEILGDAKLNAERIVARAKNEASGKIVDNDSFVKAKELILRAAMQENADAEFAMYAERLLFDVDTDEARLYLKRAAIHGNDQAREVCRELEIAF